MKVEEPKFLYRPRPSVANLRKLIIQSVEHEESTHVLQHLYVVMEQMRREEERKTPSRSLSSLRGILKSDKIDKTYGEMRDEYLLEKYGA